MREIAARSAENGCDLVVAVGGDGTINEAAQGVLNSETALGVVPTGSGNGFARNVGIPLRLEPALKLISDPSFRNIDVGKIDDHIFLVSCGIGWEAVIATLFQGSRIRGVIPYYTATLSTFLQYEPQEIQITAEPDGWQYSGRPMLFSVANMREYGVGVSIAPKALEDDGLLDVCLIPRHSLLNSVKYSPEMFRQRAWTIPGYVHHLAKRVTVTRPIAGNVHIDGTPIPAGEQIDIEVLKGALKIAVKPDS